MKRNFFVLAILIALSSCFLTPAIQAGNDKKNIDIVFVGNSITFGAQLKNRLEEAPPVIGSEYLRHKPGIGEVRFINQGRSGSTTVDYLPVKGRFFEKVVAATQTFHTDPSRLLIFSVSLGTNDSAEEGTNGCPVTPEQYYQNLKTITNQLIADFPGCKIIYQQPIWYSPNTYNSSRYLATGLARLQSYFPTLKALASSYSKTNPGQVFMGDTQAFKYFRKHYLTDLDPEPGNAGTFYLHPNKKGAVVLANYWAEAIYKKILKE